MTKTQYSEDQSIQQIAEGYAARAAAGTVGSWCGVEILPHLKNDIRLRVAAARAGDNYEALRAAGISEADAIASTQAAVDKAFAA